MFEKKSAQIILIFGNALTGLVDTAPNHITDLGTGAFAHVG